MNENTNTWNISADAATNTLFFEHIVNGAPSGAIVASLEKTVGGFGVIYQQIHYTLITYLPPQRDFCRVLYGVMVVC
jgi:hypothetical protein